MMRRRVYHDKRGSALVCVLFDEAEMKADFVVIRRIVCGAVWFIEIKRHESQCP